MGCRYNGGVKGIYVVARSLFLRKKPRCCCGARQDRQSKVERACRHMQTPRLTRSIVFQPHQDGVVVALFTFSAAIVFSETWLREASSAASSAEFAFFSLEASYSAASSPALPARSACQAPRTPFSALQINVESTKTSHGGFARETRWHGAHRQTQRPSCMEISLHSRASRSKRPQA